VTGVGQNCVFLDPGGQGKGVVAFGGFDCGVAVHPSLNAPRTTRDKDRPRHLEQLHHQPVACVAVCDDGTGLVTGSCDGTIRIWALPRRSLQHAELQATLCGHAEAVRTLDVCPGFGVVVSGGADALVNVWELRTGQFLRCLPRHPAPVTSVSINSSTGDILTLAGFDLRLHTVNGVLTALSSLANVPRVMGHPPTSMVSTHCREWASRGIVAAVGHDNGAVTLWSIAPSTPSRSSDAGGSQRLGQDPAPSEQIETPASLESEGVEASGAAELTVTESARHVVRCREFELRQYLTPREDGGKAAVTALRVANRGSDLLAGDAAGALRRWTTLRLDQLSNEDLRTVLYS